MDPLLVAGDQDELLEALAHGQDHPSPDGELLDEGLGHAGRRGGELLSRATNDVAVVRKAVSSMYRSLPRDGLLVIVYLAIVFLASWRLALLCCIVFPVLSIIIGLIGRRIRRHSSRAQALMGDVASIFQETIGGIRVVKAFGAERFTRGRFLDATQGYLKSIVRLRRVGALASPTAELMGAIHGPEARQRVIIERDLQVLKALEVLPAAERMPIVALELDGLEPESSEPREGGEPSTAGQEDGDPEPDASHSDTAPRPGHREEQRSGTRQVPALSPGEAQRWLDSVRDDPTRALRSALGGEHGLSPQRREVPAW